MGLRLGDSSAVLVSLYVCILANSEHPEEENFAQDIPRLTVNFCQALTGDYTPVNKPLVPLTPQAVLK